MKALRKRLVKPHYLFRPSQAWKRLHPANTVDLPWGGSMRVDPRDMIGSSLARTGAYDPPVAQALVCLTDPGETTVDVGANIGYMASALASRTERVVAIEPHPDLFRRLSQNVPHVKRLRLACSSTRGWAHLSDPEQGNAGTARLGEVGHPVQLERLDRLVSSAQVVKVDVEGHEREVLEGMGDLLGQTRDIVYEELEPSGATELLRQAGYTVFGLELGLLRARLVNGHPDNWDAPSYLATLEPERAKARLRQRWLVF